MAFLGLYPSHGSHEGITKALGSPNVYSNGQQVLISPFWACYEPDHISGPMNPTSIMNRVFVNGMGAGLSFMSIAPCTAVLYGTCFNVIVG